MRLAALLLFPALIASGQMPPGSAAEKEKVLADRYSADIRSETQPLNVPKAAALVQRIGARVVAALPPADAGHPRPAYSFEVVQPIDLANRTPEGLPNGVILTPARAITDAADERALTLSIAHAIAHVELRHGFRNARPSQGSAIPVIFFGPIHWGIMPMALAANREEMEREADAYARDLVNRLPAQPDAVGDFAAARQAVATALTSKLGPKRAPSLLHGKR